jgi:hypothetical protein
LPGASSSSCAGRWLCWRWSCGRSSGCSPCRSVWSGSRSLQCSRSCKRSCFCLPDYLVGGQDTQLRPDSSLEQGSGSLSSRISGSWHSCSMVEAIVDHFESVVVDYLRADRALFVNPQCCIQLNPGSNPDTSGPHWYCDVVAVSLRCIYARSLMPTHPRVFLSDLTAGTRTGRCFGSL